MSGPAKARAGLGHVQDATRGPAARAPSLTTSCFSTRAVGRIWLRGFTLSYAMSVCGRVELTSCHTPRFGASNLHQRDSRSALFEGYTGAGAQQRTVSASPSRLGGYGYPGTNESSGSLGIPQSGYRPATPNKKYVRSNAVAAAAAAAAATDQTYRRNPEQF